MASLAEVWMLLRDVTVVSFEARSAAPSGWNGTGAGGVTVTEPSPGVLVFAESGEWRPHRGRGIRFTNVFRWSRLVEALRLEHLRFGPEQPVFLFDLALRANGEWRAVSPHRCGADCYSASLCVRGRQVWVYWSIHGPRKDEFIEYVYQ